MNVFDQIDIINKVFTKIRLVLTILLAFFINICLLSYLEFYFQFSFEGRYSFSDKIFTENDIR